MRIASAFVNKLRKLLKGEVGHKIKHSRPSAENASGMKDSWLAQFKHQESPSYPFQDLYFWCCECIYAFITSLLYRFFVLLKQQWPFEKKTTNKKASKLHKFKVRLPFYFTIWILINPCNVLAKTDRTKGGLIR